MTNPINGINLLEQWHVAQEQLAQARMRFIQEQNAHASTRDRLVDSDEYRRTAVRHIEKLESNIRILQDRMREEQSVMANLRQQLGQSREQNRGLEDQLLLSNQNVDDIRGQLAVRELLIQRLQGEIQSIIRLKNRAIRIRDLVIEILRCSLEIEKENKIKVPVLSTTLTVGLFTFPLLAISTGALIAMVGAVKGNLHNVRQNELQNQINNLQRELELVKRSF